VRKLINLVVVFELLLKIFCDNIVSLVSVQNTTAAVSIHFLNKSNEISQSLFVSEKVLPNCICGLGKVIDRLKLFFIIVELRFMLMLKLLQVSYVRKGMPNAHVHGHSHQPGHYRTNFLLVQIVILLLILMHCPNFVVKSYGINIFVVVSHFLNLLNVLKNVTPEIKHLREFQQFG